MKNFISLVCAINFIEENLRQRISVSDVAKASYVSISHLQNMFSRTFHLSIGEYIAKRNLCLAAHDLTNTETSITDIAFDFGYKNVESFSRAFKKQFLLTPSLYRKSHAFSELYPRLIIDEKEGFLMTQKYDLTEISEKILNSKGTYIICTDIDHLSLINEKLGRSAGDAAIAETSARISKSIGDGMDYFRIGGDSFVILTGKDGLEVPESIAHKIISYSENDVVWSGGSFKFSISMGIIKIPEDISNAKVAIDMSDAVMLDSKKQGRNTYKTA